MTTIIMAILKIVIAGSIIFGTIKAETYLENKFDEVAGKRTDMLVMTSLLIVVIAAIYIAVQCYTIFRLIFLI